MHWLLSAFWSVTGIRSAAWSAWWGGLGSVLFTLALLLVPLYWHNQCSVHGCFRYARRTTAAGARACRRHHPDSKPTAADVHAAHHLALRRRDGGDA